MSLLEEVGSSPHGMDRALLQLTQAGKFKRVRSVAIGDLVGCDIPFSSSSNHSPNLRPNMWKTIQWKHSTSNGCL